jgi:hypothetical protein
MNIKIFAYPNFEGNKAIHDAQVYTQPSITYMHQTKHSVQSDKNEHQHPTAAQDLQRNTTCNATRPATQHDLQRNKTCNATRPATQQDLQRNKN